MGKDIYDFVVAVFEQLHGWVSGSALAFAVEILDGAFGLKIPRKPWITIFLIGGMFVSVFGAWQQEHKKVSAQTAYMKITTEALSWIPATAWNANDYQFMYFGKGNVQSYPALEEASMQELIIRPSPFLPKDYTVDLSSPGAEDSVWNEMLTDEKNATHYTTTYDPGERHFASANTKYKLSQAELDRILVQGTDMVYLVGLEKWKDGTGVHAKSFCKWLHVPKGKNMFVQKCDTHNDYIEDATDYLKFFK